MTGRSLSEAVSAIPYHVALKDTGAIEQISESAPLRKHDPPETTDELALQQASLMAAWPQQVLHNVSNMEDFEKLGFQEAGFELEDEMTRQGKSNNFPIASGLQERNSNGTSAANPDPKPEEPAS